jgi:hypothetical protein
MWAARRGLRELVAIVVGVASFALCPAAAGAAQLTWTGGGLNDDWSTAGDWEGGVAPTAVDGTVDLDFPLSACQSPPTLCPVTTDDVPALTVGTLTLAERIIAFTPTQPFEPPPPEPAPESYGVAGSEPVMLAAGIDASATLLGTGQGVAADGGMQVEPPLELVADNIWSVGPAPDANLSIEHSVTGEHSLGIDLASDDHLGLWGSVEVGPITITGDQYSSVTIGEPDAGGSLDGIDGQPVAIDGANLDGSGRVGPLSLRNSYLAAARIGGTGELVVDGSVSLGEHTTVEFTSDGARPGVGYGQVIASGHVQLGSATLRLAALCGAHGTALPLIEGGEGVSGMFTNPDGTPVQNGEVLATLPESCGPGTPAQQLKIEYLANAVTATATALASPATQTTSGGPVLGTPLHLAGLPGPSGRDLQAALVRDGAAEAKNLSIRSLRRHHGALIEVTALEAGTFTAVWTVAPKARARAGARTAVCARGAKRFTAPGKGALHLKLTRDCTALLAHAKDLKLTQRIAFAPLDGAVVVNVGTLTLRR